MRGFRYSSFLLVGLAATVAVASRSRSEEPERLTNWATAPYWLPTSSPPSPRPGGPDDALQPDAHGRESLAGRAPLVPGASALPFFPLPPCRLVDTRGSAPLTGGFLPPATPRVYTLTGVCGLPANAQAISVNATAVNPTGPGFLVLFAQGGALPPVSTLNFTAGVVVANAAVVPLSVTGGVTVEFGVSGGDLILDTNGYFAPAPGVTSLNAQTGDLALQAGANVTITPVPGGLSIAASVSASSISTGVLAVANGGTGASTPSASAYQARVTGTCASGGIASVNADGTVACLPAPPVTSATYGANVSQTVDSGTLVGNPNAITIGGDGLPFVAYYDAGAGALKTMKCGNPACSAGNVVKTVPGPAGASLSAAAGLDGFPVVSYFDSVNKGLRVAKCGDLACSSPIVTTVVLGTPLNILGLDNSIFVPPDGRPLVGYYQLSAGKLGFVRCGNASCSGANVSTTVDNGDDSGSYGSVAAGSDGLGWVSHYDATTSGLVVTHCTTVTCSGWTGPQPDTAGTVGQETSIAVGADGLAVVSYRDVSNGWLKVLKCGNSNCTAGNVATVVDAAAPTGFSSSIAIGADGNPVASFTGGTPPALKVLRCGNAACSSGNVVSIVDASSSFVSTSLTIAPDGLPVISYYDQTLGHLKVVKCGNEGCSASVRRR